MKIKCDPDGLQLFLTKKDGAWLSDDDALDAMLEREVDTSLFEKMCGSWRLDKNDLFGPQVSLGKGVVHVLVVLPEGEGHSGPALKKARYGVDRKFAKLATAATKLMGRIRGCDWP
ncbi:hypothetical protein PF008_g32411, partial [Phytophthora fragariae]